MISFFCQWIDRIAINHAAAHMPKPDGRDLHLERRPKRLLQNLDFSLAETKPAAVEFAGPTNFHFASPRPGGHAVNNVVHGRLYRCDDRWREKPVILLLHGWNDRLNHYYFFPRHARRLNQMGLSAATLQLPWQFDRRPRELGAWGNFLCADVLHTVEATLQAMAIFGPSSTGCSNNRVHLSDFGASRMGAWLAGLTLCHDSRIGCRRS